MTGEYNVGVWWPAKGKALGLQAAIGGAYEETRGDSQGSPCGHGLFWQEIGRHDHVELHRAGKNYYLGRGHLQGRVECGDGRCHWHQEGGNGEQAQGP